MSSRSSPVGDEPDQAHEPVPGEVGEPVPGQAHEQVPPLEANDQLVTALITAGWVIALVVLLIVRGDLPARERWWIWTTVTGLGMGVFGLVYVPHLKRSRDRTARRRAGRAEDGARPDRPSARQP